MRKTESIFSLTSSPLRLPWPIGRGSILLVFAFVLSFLTACSGDDSSSTSVDDFSSESVEASSSSVEGSSSSSKESSSSGAMPESSSSPVSSSSVVQSSSSIVAVPCKTETEDNCKYGTLVDERDGQTYRTVVIGEQEWMAENLNYAYLQPTSTLDSSSWCYDNDPENCETYGRLYLWSAAVDSAALFSEGGKGCGNVKATYGRSDDLVYQKCEGDSYRGVCPEGWRLPSEDDFFILEDAANDSSLLFKSTNGWDEECNGIDTYGLGVLPASSYRTQFSPDKFAGKGRSALFWTSSEMSFNQAAGVQISCSYSNILIPGGTSDKSDAYSVRCIKDE